MFKLCIESFLTAVNDGWCEVTVVDNFSTDNTEKESRYFVDKYPGKIKFVSKGPERSSQRNEGARNSTGKFVLFVDADMRFPEETLRELRKKMQDDNIDAFYVL